MPVSAVPAEGQVYVDVYNSTGTFNLAAGVATDLRTVIHGRVYRRLVEDQADSDSHP